MESGISQELSDREKFVTFSGFQREVLVQILDFAICSIHLNSQISP